jgi:hypothetical protein
LIFTLFLVIASALTIGLVVVLLCYLQPSLDQVDFLFRRRDSLAWIITMVVAGFERNILRMLSD